MLKHIGMAAAAGFVVLLGGQFASAQDDTVRLGTNIESKTTTLAYDGQSDTMLMRGVRGGIGGRGGFVGGRGGVVGGRGGFVGGRGGFVGGRAGFVGVRGAYYGGRGFGWGRGWGGYGIGIGIGGYGGGYGYYPSYWPYYGGYGYPAPVYYNSCYAPSVYYAPAYTYAVSTNVDFGQVAASRPSMYVVQGQSLPQLQQEQAIAPPVQGGTYQPVPLPSSPEVPSYQPAPNAGLGDGRFVGLTAAQKLANRGSSGFAYADGNAETSTFATMRLGTAVTTTKKKN